jgi:hypothetical protein
MSSRKMRVAKSGVSFARIFLPKSETVLDLFWFIRPRTEQEADELEKVLVVH